MKPSQWFKHAAGALGAALAILGAPAQAQITTPQILGQTIAAMPSCLSYQVKGMCFFLYCSWTGCRIRTSIRVSHYVPDAIVSTYNEPLMHPWVEVGKPLSAAMSSVGAAMMGMPVDASAHTARETQEITTFKSADAIANPAGMIASLLSGGSLPNLPDVFGVPGLSELMRFPSEELPRIQQEWMSVPIDAANTVLSGAAAVARAPGELLGRISALPGQLSRLQSSIGNVGSILNNGLPLGNVRMTAAQLAGIDLGPLQTVAQIASIAGATGGLGSIFCPGSSSAFTLHFQSDLDSLFWRDLIPVESLYASSWVPTRNEVSQSPLINTWGSIYPRTGQLVQSHPVKASAVYAERVRSVITKSAQPHIYKRLTPGGGFRYFSQFSGVRWQMLYPVNTGCMSFGTNDSLSLTSFGDGRTSSHDGYVWNMWNRYDCCQRRGSYLFSIP